MDGFADMTHGTRGREGSEWRSAEVKWRHVEREVGDAEEQRKSRRKDQTSSKDAVTSSARFTASTQGPRSAIDPSSARVTRYALSCAPGLWNLCEQAR